MISPLAHIHPNAKIGKNVTIEPFAYIAGKVTIGDNCYIAPHAVILDGAILGQGCQIHSGAVIAGVPQDLKFIGEDSTAVIGDNTIIREFVTINRGTAAKGVTTIGSNTLIMAYTHVGHDCTIGNHCILVNRVSLAGEVEVGDWAIISGHVAVHQFCRIGSHAMVSGGSLVNKDVPPFIKAAHQPVSFVGINSIGLRRRGFDTAQVTMIQDMCRLLFQSGFSYTKGCEMVEEQIAPSSERDMMIDFIRNSKRGIIKAYQSQFKDIEVD